MSLNRHAKKRDDNETEIVRTWEAMGACVQPVSGAGLMDTLVHWKGQIFRAEVKGAKRGLTPKQVVNFEKAFKAGVPTYVVRSPEDARIMLAGRMTPWRPADGALAGAAKKQRAFRLGTDKARFLAECCKAMFCVTSQVPGFTRCAAHLTEAA